MAYSILVVDDEKLIVKGIKFSLEQDGMNVDVAYDGEEALNLIKKNNYDLAVLHVMLPKMDGLQVCREVREFSSLPIIMVTAKGEDMDKIMGLEYGADDYMTKPFSPSELTARIDAIYRRVSMSVVREEENTSTIVSGPFELDLKSRTVSKNGVPIELTQVEYQILEYFLNNQKTALDRSSILTHIWGENYFGDDKIVDVNIRRIRMKIEDEPSNPKYISTIWGFGYKWTAGDPKTD